ncbi:sensor histidine kinase [Kocuria coralli]|uniref:sensor histidine kinase n=1 Tax=Kocuria coralli TaxID=1461025 RepID=UPI0015F2B8EB|nr:ATP-binding protein [Kocuria coralli]
MTVSTGVRSGDIEFTVSDDGPGLDAEDAANLFTPFFRGKSGMLSKTSGAGLGMAIVKSITQAHGGFVSVVETAPGKGLTCRVTLPASGPLLHRRIEPTDATSRQFSRPSLPMGD